MAITTTYGWTTPDNAGLVKNGASDIRSIGQSVDTFLNRPFTRNGVINASMQVWQRGTSISGQQGYTADRWYKLRGSDSTGQTVSRQVTGDTTNLPNIQYCARVQRAASNTSVDALYFYQPFETINSIPFAGKTVTLSFYARAGANYSSAANALTVNLNTGTGTDQNTVFAYTGSASPINQTATLTTTWQRFTYSGTVAATATEMGVQFIYTPVGTAGANDYYEITGVMVEVGNQASPFATAGLNLQAELAMCQRYYYQWQASNAYSPFATGFTSTTSTALLYKAFPVPMRIVPTVTTTGTAANYGIQNATNGRVACSAVPALNQGNTDGANIDFTTAAVLTAGAGITGNAQNTTSAYIGFSAEL
jgi:hypothetical protein